MSGLGFSYSLGKFLTKSVAWLDVLLPCSIFGNGVRTPVRGRVDVGAEPVFAFYLENQVDEKLTINGFNKAHYTEDFAYTSLERNELLSFALLASVKTK